MYRKKTKYRIVIMVALSMLLQVIGPMTQSIYATGDKGSFRIIDERLENDTAYIDWEFVLDQNKKIDEFSYTGNFTLEDTIEGELTADDGTRIGTYNISENGKLTVDIDRELYEDSEKIEEPDQTGDETEEVGTPEGEGEVPDEEEGQEDETPPESEGNETEGNEEPAGDEDEEDPEEDETPEEAQEDEENEDDEDSEEAQEEEGDPEEDEIPGEAQEDEGNEEGENSDNGDGTVDGDEPEEYITGGAEFLLSLFKPLVAYASEADESEAKENEVKIFTGTIIIPGLQKNRACLAK